MPSSAGAWLATTLLFTRADSISALYLALMVFGFFAIGGFGIVALYLTELFPVHAGHGAGLCMERGENGYGAGAASRDGPLASQGLATVGTGIAFVFAFGLLAIGFGPETARAPDTVRPS